MNLPMRLLILLICSTLMIHGVNAQSLSQADREALLENLENLRKAAEGNVDAKLRIALAAYRGASSDDNAAIELYLNCVERVNFDDQDKKAADFREWKRKNSDQLSEPAFRVALRLQLRWLVLTLMAADEDADRDQLASEAQQVVDSIFTVPEKLSGQEGVLGGSALSTVFARAYEIDHIKAEKWPASPIDLSSIYEELILPPLRTPSRVKGLQAAWIKRIQQEGDMAEYWSANEGRGRGGRPAPANAGAVAYAKFVETTRPKLQWDMELDLFRAGDESGAAVRMLTLLEKNLGHPSAKDWSDDFRALLAPVSPVETSATPVGGDTQP